MAKSHPEEEEVIDISSSEDDDDRIEAFAEAMNTVPVAVDPVTVVDLQNNPSGQSTFQLSKKVKSRSATSGSPKEHKFSGVVVTPKITSHFMPSSSARRNLASSAQRQIKRKSSSTLDACNQPVRISIPMGGGRQELKIQIGDKKLRRDSNNEKKMKCPPKVQQADSMPEVVLLSDDDDDDTVGQVDADRQFTAAIEESIRLDALKKVKEALKRKVEGTTTTTPTSAAPPEGERRKRAKLEPVAAEEYDYDPARYEVDNAYAALLHVIRSKVKDGEYVAIEKKMEKRKAGIKTEHLRSITLKEFLEIKRNQIRKRPQAILSSTSNPFWTSFAATASPLTLPQQSNWNLLLGRHLTRNHSRRSLTMRPRPKIGRKLLLRNTSASWRRPWRIVQKKSGSWKQPTTTITTWKSLMIQLALT